jgi:hypothetical protein
MKISSLVCVFYCIILLCYIYTPIGRAIWCFSIDIDIEIRIAIKMIYHIAYLFFHFFFVKASDTGGESTCGFYLAPSLTSDQYSVYAGKRFDENEIIEVPPSIMVRTKDLSQWQLDDFAFESTKARYSEVIFGIGMHLAGADDGNVNILSTVSSNILSEPVDNADVSFETYFAAAASITPGEELVGIFGEYVRTVEVETVVDENGEPREINAPSRNDTYDISTLREVGHCLTHVSVEQSLLPGAGMGLITKRSYKTGDVVTISPALIIPKHALYKMEDTDSTLINHCFCVDGSDVSLLPIGLAAMINHGGPSSNVKMQWHEWADGRQSRLKWSIETLEEFDEDPPLYVEFIALRDLAIGEEILLDYGQAWDKAWTNHAEAVQIILDKAQACREADTNDDSGINCGISELPVFKHCISTDIYPESFQSVCIGRDETTCQIVRNEHRIDNDPVLRDRRDTAIRNGADFKSRIRSGSSISTTKFGKSAPKDDI